RQAPILRSMGPNVSSAAAGMAAPLGARDNSRRAERRHTSLRPAPSAQWIKTARAACQGSLEPCPTAYVATAPRTADVVPGCRPRVPRTLLDGGGRDRAEDGQRLAGVVIAPVLDGRVI